MADLMLDDREQSEQVRKWLKANASTMILGVVVGLGGIYGWRYFQNYRVEQAITAASQYLDVASRVAEGKLDEGASFTESLTRHFAKSPYASLAALQMAAGNLETDEEKSRSELTWAFEHAESPEIAAVAAIRLARLDVAAGNTDNALATLDKVTLSTFDGLIAEIKGDIYKQRGEDQMALIAYELALETLEPGATNRQYLQMKLDELPAVDPDSAQQAGDAES